MTKTEPELADMIPHVRHEVFKIIDFLRIENRWAYSELPAELGRFVGESVSEAALIHTRCVAEFLRRTDEPADTITARDYIPGWHWTKGEELKPDLAEVHGRVAHLGLIRRTVQRDDSDFRWDEFLRRAAVPNLLDGFREFLSKLDPETAERFNKTRPGTSRTDLVAVITDIVGP